MATRTIEEHAPRPAPPAATVSPVHAWLDRPLGSLLRPEWEGVAYFGLLLFAVVTRFWDLGSRAQHHDESLHIVYSYYLYEGGKYIHDPLMHGPFQFHGIALLYFLFGGANDITGRLLAAIFGAALIATPYFLRRELGRAGALATAALFAISPLLLYYGRFARNEAFIAVFSMVMVIGIWGYLRTARLRYLALLAAGMALSWTAKEVTYIHVVIFMAFFGLRLVLAGLGALFGMRPGWSVRRDGDVLVILATLSIPQFAAIAEIPAKALGRTFTTPVVIFGYPTTDMVYFGAVVTVALLVLTALFGASWNARAWLLCAGVFYGIYILFFTTFFTNLAGFGSGFWGQLDYWLAQQDVRRGSQPSHYYFLLVPLYEFFSLTFSAGALVVYGKRLVGWWVRRLAAEARTAGNMVLRQSLLALLFLFPALLVFGVPLLLPASSPVAGLLSGAPVVVGIVVYVAVVVLAALTPFLVYLFAGGREEGSQAPHSSRESSSVPRPGFTAFLVLWIVMAFGAYSYAGEKMPWLGVHMALPLALLAGKFIGEILASVPWRVALNGRGLAFIGLQIALTAVAFLAFVKLPQALPIDAAAPTWTTAAITVGVMLLIALALVAVTFPLRRLSPFRTGQALAIGAMAVLGALTLPTAFRNAYAHGDIPIEMDVYTQTSPRVPAIKREIDRIADQTGKGKDLKILVDSTSGFTWPWAWYLRDYRNVSYVDLSSGSGPLDAQVVLVHASNEDKLRAPLSQYTRVERYPHRWWFPEDYRTPGEWLNVFNPKATTGATFNALTFADVVRGTLTPDGLRALWDYFLFRDLRKGDLVGEKALGSEDGVFYVRTGTAGAPVPEQKPAVTLPTSLVFGRKGANPGEFNEPKGIAVDARGNIFVADTQNHRIQKFGPDGTFINQIGRKGSADGEFNEPWGLAVDADGNLYVADLWNHRVQKFDNDLKFLLKFGSYVETGGRADTNPGQFFGPRGIAIAADGTVLVTDTGNKRVQRFDPNGRFLAAYGGGGRGNGQLSEPVGIAVDDQGQIWVDDTWNFRVQHFDASFNYLGQFPVAGWDVQSLANRPYLVVTPRGEVITTDPEGNRLLRYGPTGALLATIGRLGLEPGAFNLPVGIAQDALGNLYVVEAGNNRVQKFPPPQ